MVDKIDDETCSNMRDCTQNMHDKLPVYMEQKLSRSRSGLQSGLQSGSRSRRCSRLDVAFIVQYNTAHHMVAHCSVIVTSQST